MARENFFEISITLIFIRPKPTPKSKSAFGSAGRRSEAQAEAARNLAHNTISAIDHDNAIVACTDGGSRGNPGPCGAGVIITYPRWERGAGRHTEELSAGLGRGTNQLGELWAIGMVLEDIATKVRDGYTPPRTRRHFHGQQIRQGLPHGRLEGAGRQRAPGIGTTDPPSGQPGQVDHRMDPGTRGSGRERRGRCGGGTGRQAERGFPRTHRALHSDSEQ